MAESTIQQRQAVDPLVWKDLTGLAEQLRQINQTQLSGGARTLSKETLDAFLVEEQTEAG